VQNQGMPPRKTHLDSTAISILLACCLFWGFQQVLVKATIPDVPPVLQAFLRFAGAIVILWLGCHLRGIKPSVRVESLWPGLIGLMWAYRVAHGGTGQARLSPAYRCFSSPTGC
jgi:drug/metabolite transporter (DMT)-like permease